MQLSETQNNKLVNYDPDYSLNSALPLTFLLIHWHRDMLQCRGKTRDNLWWWNQILLRSCQSRCSAFLLSVHVWVHCCQRSSFIANAQKKHAPSHHFGHLGITRLLGSFLLTPEKSCLVCVLPCRIISKRYILCTLVDMFYLYFSVAFFKFLL